jgi:hypothetical protein
MKTRKFFILELENDSVYLWTAHGGNNVLGAIRNDLLSDKKEEKIYDALLDSYQGREAAQRLKKSK